MNKCLRLLMIEDIPADFLLVQRHLRKNELNADCTRVDSLSDLESAFAELPVIIVTGTIGEAKAVDLLKAGAADFVLKDDLGRLAPSLQRAMREFVNRCELRREQQRQRHLMENISHGIVLVDDNGIIFMTNPALDRVFGYASNELIGEKVEALVCDELRTKHVELRKNYMKHPEPRFLWSRHIFQGCRKDGSRFPVDISLTPFQEDGRIYVQANITDMTEQMRVEHDLRIAATVFEVQEGVMVTDRDNRILRVNKAFSKITGYSDVEVIGKDPAVLKSGLESAEFYRQMWRDIECNKHGLESLKINIKTDIFIPNG